MNNKATYEVIIAQKLEQLPLPDLQEAIWSRIEDQLDLDMPGDEGGPDAPDAPTSPDWTNLLYKAGPFAVIVAVVTIFIINKNNTAKNRSAQSNKSVPATQQVDRKPATGAGPPVAAENKTAVQKGQTVHYPAAPKEPVSQLVDSVSQQPVVASTQPPATDSVQQAAPTLVQADATEQKPAPPPQKKSRGVKGISASDYRLVPKKDSTQKNE